VKVAAYQGPYLPFGSLDAIGLIEEQLVTCAAQGVDVLCCPEAFIGGLARESDGQSPLDVALNVENGELVEVLGPLVTTSVTLIVGFTERDSSGDLFNSAAVVFGGQVVLVYRKVFPGYRTAIRAGTRLPVMSHGSSCLGILICNDLWYVEPARVLAAAGAAVLFVPSNSGHLRPGVGTDPGVGTERMRSRGENLPIARAVENTAAVVVSDIAGHHDGRVALGTSRIIDPDGVVLACADPGRTSLLVADVEGERRPYEPRGWDGSSNPAVAAAFLGLWDSEAN
jgi:predicted amidohydrolase